MAGNAYFQYTIKRLFYLRSNHISNLSIIKMTATDTQNSSGLGVLCTKSAESPGLPQLTVPSSQFVAHLCPYLCFLWVLEEPSVSSWVITLAPIFLVSDPQPLLAGAHIQYHHLWLSGSNACNLLCIFLFSSFFLTSLLSYLPTYCTWRFFELKSPIQHLILRLVKPFSPTVHYIQALIFYFIWHYEQPSFLKKIIQSERE